MAEKGNWGYCGHRYYGEGEGDWEEGEDGGGGGADTRGQRLYSEDEEIPQARGGGNSGGNHRQRILARWGRLWWQWGRA